MTVRLVKFDVVHPAEYLTAKKAEHGSLEAMSLEEYRRWLIGLRSNYSDFYTHWLNEAGGWEAEEFFLNDPLFLKKVAREVWGGAGAAAREVKRAARTRLRRQGSAMEDIVRAYLAARPADVVFARSNPMPSGFWRSVPSLAVSRLSARMPSAWHPEHFDLLFVDDPVFKAFFEMHGVPTKLNRQGFDPRVADELEAPRERYEAVFVGGLGVRNFSRRTAFVAELARHTRVDFWGYWWQETGPKGSIADWPDLEQTFHGPTSGLEMYQIFRDARIVLNDYVDLDVASGIGYNQRMFEVMGAGGFLLTRAATNLAMDFPPNVFATYTDLADCLDKIRYYETNEAERREMAAVGQATVLERYSFRDIALEFGGDVRGALEGRRATR
ncbi:glycosyltransferase family protein [Acuticoccus sp.]|uniref:glycosyltransferase family protein n=1 Tax=Acuticoccus sp. TaxID=1904378 RepID=UPI003B52E619